MESGVDKVYEEFWKEIVEKPDGSLDTEQIKRELYDFKMVMDIASKVYCELTRGCISKPHTDADTIIRVVNDLHTQDCQDIYQELEVSQ